MKIVVFGLSISSAWGNGHATLLRGLFRALHGLGHELEFFERDLPYYASHRDRTTFPFVRLDIYSSWTENLNRAQRALADADAAIITSYCPDGAEASDLVLQSTIRRKAFYDMDTPVTLNRLEQKQPVPYVPGYGLGDFDLVLSYTGGRALDELRSKLGARCVSALYGWVDPDVYYRVGECPAFVADLSYLGTYSQDRQAALEALLLHPARDLLHHRFVIGGAMYPNPHVWPANVHHFDHVAPPEHSAFYSSSPLTLNVTRGSMAAMGYCPSGRLFEAAACGTTVVSDWWTGLDSFFEPGKEILIASSSPDAVAAITRDRAELKGIGTRAKERALDCHTAKIRARRLIELLETPADEAWRAGAVAGLAKGA